MLYPARLHDIVISRRVVTVRYGQSRVTCRRFPEIPDTVTTTRHHFYLLQCQQAHGASVMKHISDFDHDFDSNLDRCLSE